MGSRKCSWNLWCKGEHNCDNVVIDDFAELQAEVDVLEHTVDDLTTLNDGLNQSLNDLTNEVAEMREAFKLVTAIMVTEFEQ